MTGESEVGTADTMSERADESRVKRWLLLDADRVHVAVVLTVGVFVAFLVAGVTLTPPMAQLLSSGDTIDTIFATMITVLVTGTTLVVTIGQLVLSQENGPLGDQRERMRNSMDVREDVGAELGSPSPTEPAAFLDAIVGLTARRATALDDAVGQSRHQDLRTEVESFTESVHGNAESVREQLDGARFGTFAVVGAALDFNYSWKLAEVARIGDEYGEHLDEDATDALDELETALRLFGPAREHVKTLYFQWGLIDLSQLILYAAVPAIAVSGIMIGSVDAATFPGRTLGLDHLVFVVTAAFAVGLLPFMLFVSYLLRILTIAKRTLAIEPLILRESRRG